MEIKPTLHKLSNGISVILDPMDVETDEVCICFKTGSLDEEDSERGLTHFCEHMFFKGTPRFSICTACQGLHRRQGGLYKCLYWIR